MMVWKKKSINLKLHKLTKTFDILIMLICYHILWSVEKIQKVKSKCCKEKRKNNAFIKMCSVWC